MVFFLDADTASYVARGTPSVIRRLGRHPPSEIAVSVITAAELRFGMAKLPHATKTRRRVDEVLEALTIVDFTDADASVYGGVRAQLERAGTPIGRLDTLIAAHALSRGATLVTNNRREFERVPGLRVESWL